MFYFVFNCKNSKRFKQKEALSSVLERISGLLLEFISHSLNTVLVTHRYICWRVHKLFSCC